MNKKIKHYRGKDSLYPKRKYSWVKNIMIALAIALLAFIGWSTYDPVMDFLNNYRNMSHKKTSVSSDILDNSSSQNPEKNEVKEESKSQSSETSKESKPEDIKESQAQSKPEDEEDEESSENQKEQGFTRAVYIPMNLMTDFEKAYDYYKEKAKQLGEVNGIIFDVKDNAGNIYLPIKNPIASKNKAISELSESFYKTLKGFKNKNIKTFGIVSAFRDHIAPPDNPSMQIKYLGTDYAWVDRSPENGGKQWLNPYSAQSWDYIINIAEQSISMGVDTVVFTNVNFPTGEALEKASYGEESIGKTKAQALKGFADRAGEKLKKDEYMFRVNAYNMVYENQMVFGGNPAEIMPDNIMLVMSIKSFGKSFAVNGKVCGPFQNVTQLGKVIFEEFNDSLKDKVNSLCILGSDGENIENTENFIKEQGGANLIIM